MENVADAAVTHMTAQHDALVLQMASASGAFRDNLYAHDRSVQRLLAAVKRCRQTGAPVTEDIWKVYAELLRRPCVVVKHANWTEQDVFCFEATEYASGQAAPAMHNSRVSSRVWVLQEQNHFSLLFPQETLRLGRLPGFPDNEYVVLNAGDGGLG